MSWPAVHVYGEDGKIVKILSQDELALVLSSTQQHNISKIEVVDTARLTVLSWPPESSILFI